MKLFIVAVVALTLSLGVVAPTAAGTDRIAGTVYFQDPQLGERLETRGQPVEQGVSLLTQDRFAIVVLENSRIVKIAANSAVRFEEGRNATFTMTVYAGYASTVGLSGRVLRVGAVGSVDLPPRSADALRVERALLEDEAIDPVENRRRARRR